MLGKEGRSPPFRTEIASNQGSDKELQVAAKFFTESFWTDHTTGSGRERSLTENQFRLLFSSQVSEFRKRYGMRKSYIGNGKGIESKLLMSTRIEQSEPCGCIGVQVLEIVCPVKGCKTLAPVMSDLVINGKYRRMGLAEDLIQAAEDLASLEWGYNECYLFVDEENTPALRLYKKLGYKVVDKEIDTQILRPNTTGGIGKVSAVILRMRKKIMQRKGKWW